MEIKQIIRLKSEGLSNRKVADLLNVSRNTVNEYIRLFEARSLTYDSLLQLDDASLADLFPKSSEVEHYRFKVLSGYFTYFESELKKPGCTLFKLWEWYIDKHPDGYKHAQFHVHFSNWRSKIKGSCKLEHKAAERVFVDFTGKKLPIVDKQTGDVTDVNVFVAILPASQYVFVKAVPTQSREDFIDALSHCLDFYGGVPRAIVCDNLKSAVSKGSKYAPQINKTLQDFALHYGCVVDPTRPYAPQDKAMVEGAVKLVYQRIFYPLSKHTFFSLAELNKEIAVLVDQYNNYSFSQSPTTRLQEFLTIEKPFLNPLPSQSYGIKYFKRLKVQKMGFVYLSDDKHYYSVPYKHIGQYVEVSFNQSIIEIFSNRQRIAIHKRDYRPGKYTALEDHLSSHHKAYSNWSLDYFQYKASKIGPSVQEYITRLILHYAYPELGYKQALGIIMFTKQYSPEQIDKACKKAMPYPSCSFYIIENILKNKLENEPDLFTEQSTHISPHENLRGPQAYS